MPMVQYSRTASWLIMAFMCISLISLAHADPWRIADQQLRDTLQDVAPNRYPHIAASDWQVTDAGAWTSGFFPGALWAMYHHTQDPMWRAEAETQQAAIESQKTRTNTHDLGFMFFPSYVNAYRLTGHQPFAHVALTAANALDSRYVSAVGVIKTSWPGSETGKTNTIIDTLMNLELLFWGASTGGKASWAQHAQSHALKAAANHVRIDGSTYHLVTYRASTGAVLDRGTAQGHADESTWARGQAWGIYGFTTAYRYTGHPTLLEAARRTADWWISHLPTDDVPYWDFEAPNLTSQPRDSSAAAIAASGLLDLATADPDPARQAIYRAQAEATLRSLVTSYLSPGPSKPSILLHGVSNKPANKGIDTGLIYGDYYFLEALVKAEGHGLTFEAPPPPTSAPIPSGIVNLPVKAVTASTHDGNLPKNVIDGKLSTRWSANGNNQWIRLDLGATKTLAGLMLAWYQGASRQSHFDVQTSGNGTSWTTRWSGSSSGTTTQLEPVDFTDVTARYVRILGHGNTVNLWNSVTEVDVYGK